MALETSGTTGGTALLEETHLLGSLTFTSATLYSQRLLPSVEWLLERTGRRIEEVTAVAVSHGPGSFTGLRIGLSAAKAIAYANGAMLVAVNTLEALALRAAPGSPEMQICPVLDARQGEVYAALFRAQHDERMSMPHLDRLQDDFAGHIDDLAKWISRPTVFTGEGALRYADRLRDIAGANFRAASTIRNLPTAEEIAWLGMQRLQRGEQDDLLLLEPHYLRRSYTQKRAK